MIHRHRLALGLAAGILGVASSARAGDLAGDLRKLVGARPDTGVQVIDCATGASLYSHNPNEPFIPASNLKVFTTAAALLACGPEFNFETRLFAHTTEGHTSLTLVGSGDPALFDAELRRPDGSHGNWTTVGATCEAWAQSLRASGVSKVDEFVVDARIFDQQPCPVNDQKWMANRTDGTYAVGVWGLNIAANAAVLQFDWVAGKRPTIASSEPPVPWRIVENVATCGSAPRDFGVGFGAGPGEIRLVGGLKRATDTAEVGVLEPLPLYAEMFARELSRHGVEVARWRVAGADDAEPTGSIVPPVLTTPITTVLYGANTHSKNICADALVKLLGAARTNAPQAVVGPSFKSGTFESGEEALKAFLDQRLGSGCSGMLCARDGSGLSAHNRVTADLTARLVASMAVDARLGNFYLASFARPEEEGTLKKRFRNTDLHGALVLGKSGFINGVCCLSGLVVGDDGRQTGRKVSYSVLCNKAEPAAAKKLHEDIVARIALELAQDRTRTAAAGDRH